MVGAGFGGIASALRLSAKGYRVTLIDRAPMLGGRAQVFEKDGFKHDAGPTVITAPFLIEELFELFGKKSGDYFTLKPLTPWYRFYFDEDGSTFDYGGTLEETLAAMRAIDPLDGDGYLRMLDHSKALFDAGFTNLADQPFHNPFTMVGQIPRLVQLGSYRSVWDFVTKYFHSPKIRQALSIQPLLVGGSPFDTTSIYGLIHYLERKWGVFYAEGGTGAIVAALGKLMEEEGVNIRLNTTVASIVLEGGTATGVRLENGAVVPADIVVSDVDPMHLFGDMIPARDQGMTARLKRKTARLSMGLFLMYFGTSRQYPELARHTIWLGKRYKGLLDDIFRRKVLAEDFSLYIHRPTATDPSFAPEGCDAYYVLCPVPNLLARYRLEDRGSSPQRPHRGGPRAHDPAGVERDDKGGNDDDARRLQNQLSQPCRGRFLDRAALHAVRLFPLPQQGGGDQEPVSDGRGHTPRALAFPGVICSAKVVDRLVPQFAA